MKASKTPFTGKEPTTLKYGLLTVPPSGVIKHLVINGCCRRNPGLWQRIMSLEARASLRQSKFSVVYLPILYPLFGVVLGVSCVVVMCVCEEEGLYNYILLMIKLPLWDLNDAS